MISLPFKQENKRIFGYGKEYKVTKENSKAGIRHISSHKKDPVSS